MQVGTRLFAAPHYMVCVGAVVALGFVAARATERQPESCHAPASSRSAKVLEKLQGKVEAVSGALRACDVMVPRRV